MEEDTFKNRRRMAWICLVLMILSTGYFVIFLPIERVDPVRDIIITFLWTMSSVILVYMGAAAYEHASGIKTHPIRKPPVKMNESGEG